MAKSDIKEFGISITWSVEDVLFVREDLTEDQAVEVLELIQDTHEASIGINWDVLQTGADMLFPKQGTEN